MSKAADLRSLRFDLAPVIDRRIPTLLIGAEEDSGANAALKRIHESLAESKLLSIPASGHLAFFESAKAYNGAVLDFLSNPQERKKEWIAGRENGESSLLPSVSRYEK